MKTLKIKNVLKHNILKRGYIFLGDTDVLALEFEFLRSH